MRKRQVGQAFIMVLILMAMAALMVVPMLNLTSTSLRSSQIVTRRSRLLYAADAMQEYVMWKLSHDGWTSSFLSDGDTGYLNLDLCGVSVNATIVMRAVPGKGGVTLSTDDLMRPTKTVTASDPVSPEEPDHVANKSTQTLTYIIRMEQLSSNTTQGLDAVYDILPIGFGTSKYVADSSYLRVDGGSWQAIGDPSTESYGGRERLRWPASGDFTEPIRSFSVRQVKELKFDLYFSSLPASINDYVLYNYVVLIMGDIVTFSGQQAPVTIGDGDKADPNGMIVVEKVADPAIILPGVETPVEYTISITSQDNDTVQVSSITDNLPPEFFYTINSTSGVTTNDPEGDPPPIIEINGVDRQQLVWNFSPQIAIATGETKTLVFSALATKDVSGSYYNEILVVSDFNIPAIFADIGLTQSEFNSGYSWQSGTVTVPAYDSEVNAEGVIIDANLALQGLSGITINSYQVH
ncbi:hypothetical protein ACFLW5_02185 [Chloroflexota bacterium]